MSPGQRSSAKSRAFRRHWLLKVEPEVFSYDALAKAPKRTTSWGGVRNFQARNLLRDELALGDGVLYYHSNAEPSGVAGLARVVRAGYPDPTQFERGDPGHDPRSTPAAPRWFAVDVQALKRLPRFVALAELRADERLAGMVLLRRGSRLSVQPVTPAEWRVVLELGGLGGVDPLA
jgi:predicted RNA-binding protein with PUA-like domain